MAKARNAPIAPTGHAVWNRVLRTAATMVLVLTSVVGLVSPASAVSEAAPLADVLPVPWVRQYQNLATSDCDCGPAAVAMVVEYYKGLPDGVTNSDLVAAVRDSTGNFGVCTRASGWSADTGFAQLEGALTDFRLANDELSTVQAIKDAINSFEPVIALVHGADLGRSNYGEHWVVVTGFGDDGSVFLNDPDDQNPRGPGWRRGGQGVSIPGDVFARALADTGYGSYGIVVHGYPPGGAPTPPAPPVLDRQVQVDMITRAYRGILGRDPDPGGLNYYLATGLDESGVNESLLNSDECRLLLPSFGCLNRWGAVTPPGPSLPATAPPGTVLYEADWSRGLSGWVGSPDWSTVGGLLTNDGSRSYNRILAPYHPQTTDYAVEVETRMLRGNDVGVFLRRSSAGQYEGGVDCYAACVFVQTSPPQYLGGEHVFGFHDFRPGSDWHAYRLTAKGDALTFSIDGTEWFHVRDSTMPPGDTAGIFIGLTTQLQVRAFRIIAS